MPKSSTAYAYAPLEADETSTYPADLTPALQETLAILAASTPTTRAAEVGSLVRSQGDQAALV